MQTLESVDEHVQGSSGLSIDMSEYQTYRDCCATGDAFFNSVNYAPSNILVPRSEPTCVTDTHKSTPGSPQSKPPTNLSAHSHSQFVDLDAPNKIPRSVFLAYFVFKLEPA